MTENDPVSSRLPHDVYRREFLAGEPKVEPKIEPVKDYHEDPALSNEKWIRCACPKHTCNGLYPQGVAVLRHMAELIDPDALQMLCSWGAEMRNVPIYQRLAELSEMAKK